MSEDERKEKENKINKMNGEENSNHGEIEDDKDDSGNKGNRDRKQAKHDSGVADLEKVTDYAEEKEVSSQDIMGALSLIRDRQDRATAAKIERERELLRVQVSKEDVDLIVNEMEISRSVAERTLRKHNGDVVAALTALTD